MQDVTGLKAIIERETGERPTYNIACGDSRFSTNWINKKFSWDDLLNKIKVTKRTNETVKEYSEMTKAHRDNTKDIGGFVCGYIEGRHKKKENILSRSMITLDMDHNPVNIWDVIEINFNYTCLLYSTHSHTPEKPRYRLVIPLDRDVTPVEYEPISRMVASDIDKSMKIFDDTTHQVNRLMYWPSTSCDGEYIFKYQNGEVLKADEVLNRYTFGWKDSNYWPRSEREYFKNKNSSNTVQDPTTKTGIIGAFCKTYNIHEAIETFLNDEYISGKDDTRYTYTKGESANGLHLMNDNLVYSYQDTDPISGHGLCNAFDFVRLHKFGELDSNEDLKTLSSEDLESFKRMCKFVMEDSKANNELLKDDFNKVESNKKNKRDVRIMPLGESLLQEPIAEYDFLVNRLLYDGAVNLISGDPKTFKTYLAIDIALGVVTKTETLGHPVLKKGKVLFISTEFDVRNRFVELYRGRGISDKSVLDDIITFIYDSSIDTFQWKKDLKFLEDILKEYRPKLLVLDPLSYIFDGDINKNDEVGQFFKELKVLVREYKLSTLLIHHNNRMSESKRMNNVSGSSAITRFADSIIYLEKFKEDEEQDINKTDDELDREIKPIKLIKGPYRHGREGYKYYTINFKSGIDRTEISAERLEIKSEFDKLPKVKAKNRDEQISDRIIEALDTGQLNSDKFSKKDVMSIINNDFGLTKKSFDQIVKEVLKNMVQNREIGKCGERSYKSNRL